MGKSKMNPKINKADMGISDMQLERLGCRRVKKWQKLTPQLTPQCFSKIYGRTFSLQPLLDLNKCIHCTDANKFD